MGALANQRHERFCLLIVQGNSAEAAYEKAGYKGKQANAKRLTKNDLVQRRVTELQRQERRRMGVTRESQAAEFEEIRDAAAAAGQYGAAAKAQECISKLHGLFIDKKVLGLTNIDNMSEQQLLEFLGGEPGEEELELLAHDRPQIEAKVIGTQDVDSAKED